jgi:hypothetical protein
MPLHGTPDFRGSEQSLRLRKQSLTEPIRLPSVFAQSRFARISQRNDKRHDVFQMTFFSIPCLARRRFTLATRPRVGFHLSKSFNIYYFFRYYFQLFFRSDRQRSSGDRTFSRRCASDFLRTNGIIDGT